MTQFQSQVVRFEASTLFRLITHTTHAAHKRPYRGHYLELMNDLRFENKTKSKFMTFFKQLITLTLYVSIRMQSYFYTKFHVGESNNFPYFVHEPCHLVWSVHITPWSRRNFFINVHTIIISVLPDSAVKLIITRRLAYIKLMNFMTWPSERHNGNPPNCINVRFKI